MGHVVSIKGVQPDDKKMQAMVDWPQPQNLKQLRGFLGLTGYYGKFIRAYAVIASPLTKLLKQDAFLWTEAAQQAFELLKVTMTTAYVLSLPNFSQLFEVETGASNIGIGAVLHPNGHPLAFYSKKLSSRISAASTYIKELYAISQSVLKWRHYLLGRQFTIKTNHRSLKHLMEQVIQTPEQHHYLSKLLGFSYTIVYRPGIENGAADALSRHPLHDTIDQAISLMQAHPLPSNEMLLSFTTTLTCNLLTELLKENGSSAELLAIHQACLMGTDSDHTVDGGMVYYQGKLRIPSDSALRDMILQEYHNSPIGGHGWVLKTFKRISTMFFWPTLRKDVNTFVTNYAICQQTKYSTAKPAGLLQPLPVPEEIWQDVTMDFIVGLPNSKGFTAILVVVDRLSKAAHFGTLPSQFTASSVAKLFAEIMVKLHGFPRTIISDRDSIFVSKFWRELLKLSGTILRFSSAYHPQTDGQTEVINRSLEQYLGAFVFQQPKAWSQFLPWAELWYSTSFHSGGGMTPFKAVYGKEPSSIPQYYPGDSTVQAVDADLTTRNTILHQLKINLQKAQASMKKNADVRRREVHFVVNDWVLVKLHHYKQQSVAVRLNFKLAQRYFGPFHVIQKIGVVAYKLALPEYSKIHHVFHVYLLKPFLGPIPSSPVNQLPVDLDNLNTNPVPMAILDTSLFSQQGTLIPQVLVQWQDVPLEDATWEELATITSLFPQLHLEDHVNFDGIGDDTRPTTAKSYNWAHRPTAKSYNWAHGPAATSIKALE